MQLTRKIRTNKKCFYKAVFQQFVVKMEKFIYYSHPGSCTVSYPINNLDNRFFKFLPTPQSSVVIYVVI